PCKFDVFAKAGKADAAFPRAKRNDRHDLTGLHPLNGGLQLRQPRYLGTPRVSVPTAVDRRLCVPALRRVCPCVAAVDTVAPKYAKRRRPQTSGRADRNKNASGRVLCWK